MKRLWQTLGGIVFWISWPLLALYLRRHPRRTRIVIAHGTRIVVTKRWPGTGKWGLPGGGLQKRETSLAGVVREVAEETGLQLDPARIRPLFSGAYRSGGLRFDCQYFAAEMPEAAPLHGRFFEIIDVAWLERAALTAQNAGPDVLAALDHMAAKSPRS